MARAGIGRRVVQYNPGARTLAEYAAAAVRHQRGAHDEGGKVIHQTSKEKRREYAAQIWELRHQRYGPTGRAT